MDKRERAERFTVYVGLELKGRIVSRGFTAAQVADQMGRSRAAFSRWLNGKQSIPLSVVCEASEIIGVEPGDIVAKAYDRLAVLHGEAGGEQYDGELVERERQLVAQELEEADAPGVVVEGRFRKLGATRDFPDTNVAHVTKRSIFDEQEQRGE